jgi:steroid 5-alpha reductase family enzyme
MWTDLIVPFLVTLSGMMLVMASAWLVQRANDNAGWVDVFWTFGTGAAGVIVALWPMPAQSIGRQILVAALSAVWAIRLGAYIALRVAGTAEDTRYVHFKAQWGSAFQRRLLGFVLLQAPATALLMLSVLVAAHGGAPVLGLRDLLGAGILLIAIGGEAIADEQMRQFKARRDRDLIFDRGLWAWSRHPNYFFEWFGWLAYPALAFDPATPLTYLTWLAPALMYLILRHGTGVPALEASLLRSRGDAFRAYQSRVSAFFPLPPRGRQT